MKDLESEINIEGFIILNDFFDFSKIERIEKNLKELGVFDFTNSHASTFNLLKYSRPLFDLANNIELKKLISKISNCKMFPVKAFVLDKTLENNWEIPWHQDLKIAVHEKLCLDGYTNWSLETGITHVQPPVEIMDQLLTLRIHFDSCSEENAAIAVVPGSHTRGIIEESMLSLTVKKGPVRSCGVDKYGIMFMKPLLLHNSPLSSSSMSRRTLQLEYGFEFDNGLQWHDL